MNTTKKSTLSSAGPCLSLYDTSHNKYDMAAIMSTPPPLDVALRKRASGGGGLWLPSLTLPPNICQSSPFSSATAIGPARLGSCQSVFHPGVRLTNSEL